MRIPSKRAIMESSSRNANIKLATIGGIAGGSISLMCCLLIFGELNPAIPLAFTVAGACIGATAFKRFGGPPLPKGYDWSIPSEAAREGHSADCVDDPVGRPSETLSPGFAIDGIRRVRELFEAGKYWEAVPAGYLLACDVLRDLLASSTQGFLSTSDCKMDPDNHRGKCERLVELAEELRKRGVILAKPIEVKRLDRMYAEYRGLLKARLNDTRSRLQVKRLAGNVLDLVSIFLR